MLSRWGGLAVTWIAAFGAAAMGMVASCNSPPRLARAPTSPAPVDAGAIEAGTDGDAGVEDASAVSLTDDPFALVDAAVNEALAAHKAPGCVVVVGRHDDVLLRRAYGLRSIEPEQKPMTLDTVFDL